MFRLNKAQIEAFRALARQNFERRARAHLDRFFPSQCAALGDERVVQLISLGVQRARECGLTSERAVCIYIDVMFGFGVDFERDPRFPWFEQVFAGNPEPRALAYRLRAAAPEHRQDAVGIDGWTPP